MIEPGYVSMFVDRRRNICTAIIVAVIGGAFVAGAGKPIPGSRWPFSPYAAPELALFVTTCVVLILRRRVYVGATGLSERGLFGVGPEVRWSEIREVWVTPKSVIVLGTRNFQFPLRLRSRSESELTIHEAITHARGETMGVPAPPPPPSGLPTALSSSSHSTMSTIAFAGVCLAPIALFIAGICIDSALRERYENRARAARDRWAFATVVESVVHEEEDEGDKANTTEHHIVYSADGVVVRATLSERGENPLPTDYLLGIVYDPLDTSDVDFSDRRGRLGADGSVRARLRYGPPVAVLSLVLIVGGAAWYAIERRRTPVADAAQSTGRPRRTFLDGPNDVLAAWPLGIFDPDAAALIDACFAPGGPPTTGSNTILAASVVAILEPAAKRANHYRIFDRYGMSIGAVVAHRSPVSPHWIRDRRIRFVDRTGIAFEMDWRPARGGWSGYPEILATVSDPATGQTLGSCTATGSCRGEVRDPQGHLLASTPVRDEPVQLVDPAGRPVARIRSVGRHKGDGRWPWQARPEAYSQAKVIEFQPSCTLRTRALVLSMVICAEVQRTKDIGSE